MDVNDGIYDCCYQDLGPNEYVYHLLVECPIFANERNLYISKKTIFFKIKNAWLDILNDPEFN